MKELLKEPQTRLQRPPGSWAAALGILEPWAQIEHLREVEPLLYPTDQQLC